MSLEIFEILIKHMVEDIWENNDTNTKFKMGEKINFKEKEAKIIGVNVVSENEVEYALENKPFLVWEDDLKKIGE